MSEFSGSLSGIHSVVIELVKNTGKTNASIPLIITIVCAKAIGCFLSSPIILTLKVKVFSSVLIILNNNLIPLKINSNVWSL